MADREQIEDTEAGSPAEGAEDQGGFSEAFGERAKPEAGGEGEASQTVEAPASTTNGEPAAAGSGDAPSKEAADDGSGTKAPAFDPYSGLSPEQQAYFAKLAASEKSQRGRVGALTKKVNSLTKDQGTQAPPSESEEEHGKTGSGEGEGDNANDLEKRLKSAVDEYGDVIGPLHETVEALRKELGELKASATRNTETTDEAELQKAYTALEQKHPDYKQIGSSPEFAAWVGKQDEDTVALLNSYDPEEVSLGLQLYKAERAVAAQVTEAGNEGGNGDASGDKRKRQLDGLRDTGNSRQPAASGVGNDFGSAFRARAKTN